MITISAGQHILRRYITNNVSTISFRFRSNAEIANELEFYKKSDTDLPTIDKNPYQREEEKCILCKHNIEPTYKNVRLLSQFQSQYTGRIYGRHITGLCKHKQERVEQEILKAQSAGLMGYMTKDPKFYNDPKLFDPNFPFKPHKY